MRHLTVLTDPLTFGDGVSEADALRLAQAERDAVIRKFPDAVVTLAGVDDTDGRPIEADDPELRDYADGVWLRIEAENLDADVEGALAVWAKE